MAATQKFIKQILDLTSDSDATKLSKTKHTVFGKSDATTATPSKLAPHIAKVPGQTVIGIFRKDNSRLGRAGSILPVADDVIVLFENTAETGTATFEALHSRSYGGRIAGIYGVNHVTEHLKVAKSLSEYVGLLSKFNYDERAFYQVNNDKVEQLLTEISSKYGDSEGYDDETNGPKLFKDIQKVIETNGYSEIKQAEKTSFCSPQ